MEMSANPVMTFLLCIVDDEMKLLSDDSYSDFEESVIHKKQTMQKPKKDDLPKEPINTASSLLNILTGLLDSEVNNKQSKRNDKEMFLPGFVTWDF